MLALSEQVAEIWCPPTLVPALEVLAGQGPARRVEPLLLMGGAGMGKSSCLQLLVGEAIRAGSDVVLGTDPAPGPEAGGPAVRFVDDAHELDAGQVDILAEEAAAGRMLVLTARPWPQSEALTRLMGLLHGQKVVMLGAWEPTDVEAFLGATVPAGEDGQPDRVEALVRLSGGLPWLVAGLAAVGPRPAATDVAGAVQARFRRLSREAGALVEELAVGFTVDDCPSVTQSDPDVFDVALAEVDAAGLLTPSGELPPAVAIVIADDLPIHRRRRLHRDVVASLPAHGIDDRDRFARLSDAGVRDDHLAGGLVEIGDDLLVGQPAQANRWYDRAVAAGIAPAQLVARRAEAALRAGDPYEAARLADTALATSPPSDPARSARVALAVSGRTGAAAHAVELGRLLGPSPSAADIASAGVVLLGQGQREEFDRVVARHRPRTALPTLQEEVSTLVIEGLAASLTPAGTDALPRLARAAQVASTACDEAMVPRHPAGLAALVALHGGDPALAARTADRAREASGPGSPWYRSFALVAGWARMMQGDLVEAAREREQAMKADAPPTTRDAFWDAALAVGLARRGDEPAALVRAWQGINADLVIHQVDVYDLLPLGELHLAAVRVKDETAVSAQLGSAWELLGQLGSPPLWETPLRWAGVRAAILANRPQDIAPHAQALVRHAATFPYAATLAAAGRVWVQVLAERFDVDEVITTAHRLRDVGQPWEAGRLLGHAAAHADTRKDSSRLLEAARAIGEVAAVAHDHDAAGPTVRLPLSDREQQVARLVVAGHTYKEVGARLFLSERTVEHHMARIRQRIGAGSRAELLDRLRSMLDGGDTVVP